MPNMLEQYEGSAEQLANDEPTEENLRIWQEYGKGWADFVFACYRLKRQGSTLERVSIRVGWTTGADSLVTLVAVGEDGSVVAFHGAEGAGRVWTRLANRLLADTLKWKEDQYAE